MDRLSKQKINKKTQVFFFLIYLFYLEANYFTIL